MRADVAADIQNIFNDLDRATAEKYLRLTIQKYGKSVLHLSAWQEPNLPEKFTFIEFSIKHRYFIQTTYLLERVNREI